jgi:redox-sensitive bicupin YhaK (pirin superfamily)
VNNVKPKSVIAAHALKEEMVRSGFSAVSLRQPELDPFIDVTLFSMSQPTFPPHPHAGFSAVTYMLPESEGSFTNRDSLGDSSVIAPGDIHWTQAGAGMMHEEIPLQAGVACRGFQIFVKLPKALELLPPVAFHADADAISSVMGEGFSLRVLVGSFNGIAPALDRLAHDVFLYDITLESGAMISLPVQQDAAVWAMVMQGDIKVANASFDAPHGIFWSEVGNGVLLVGGKQVSRILIGGGKPLNEDYQFGGPFALSTIERLSDARRRYSNGGMGALAPSF